MRIPLTCLTVFICSFVLAQSPWVAEKGKGFAQIGYSAIGPYSNLYVKDGSNYQLSREVTDATIQLYGEYGLGSQTSIITSIPFKLLKTGAANQPSPTITENSFSTIGNIQLAGRHNFINKKGMLTGQLLVELPSAGYDNATGLRGGLDAMTIVPSISFGASSTKLYEYVSAGAAIRSNGYSSEWRLNIELGYQIINHVYLIAVLDRVQNFENGNAIESPQQLQTGLYLNNQSFLAYGIKGLIGITDHAGISGAYYGAGSGHLVAKSPSVNFGLYYKW